MIALITIKLMCGIQSENQLSLSSLQDNIAYLPVSLSGQNHLS